MSNETKWFIVGLDGDKTPDPAYWRDRWELIKASDHHQARKEYIRRMDGWLRTDEQRYIFKDEVDPDKYCIGELSQVSYSAIIGHVRTKGGE